MNDQTLKSKKQETMKITELAELIRVEKERADDYQKIAEELRLELDRIKSIDDSDIKTIRDALRASYNWSRSRARTEEGEMRDGYIKDATRFKVVLDKLKKPRVNMNNCQQCGKFREHGHECEQK